MDTDDSYPFTFTTPGTYQYFCYIHPPSSIVKLIVEIFQRFMARFSKGIEGVVAIDGKVLRRSFDRASGKSALHMVSAWGCHQRLVRFGMQKLHAE